MPDRVPFPQFELVGPPCENPGCKGVLTQYINWRAKECFKRCSVCKGEFFRMPVSEMLGAARRTIERALKGERPS